MSGIVNTRIKEIEERYMASDKSVALKDIGYLLTRVKKLEGALQHIAGRKRLDRYNCTLQAVQEYALKALEENDE